MTVVKRKKRSNNKKRYDAAAAQEICRKCQKNWTEEGLTVCKMCFDGTKDKARITHKKRKEEYADERLSKISQQRTETTMNTTCKGCGPSCLMDLDGYFAYVEARPASGREAASFKESSREYQIIRKKALAIEMDHNDESKKTCNLSTCSNGEKRWREIKGPPGCTARCIPCHRWRTRKAYFS